MLGERLLCPDLAAERTAGELKASEGGSGDGVLVVGMLGANVCCKIDWFSA
jgi:hypothetical protein